MTTMMDKKKVLGRGLDSLIPAARSVAAVSPAVTGGEGVQQIPLEEIERNPYQTRGRAEEQGLAELAASIRATGVLQPIVVRHKPAGSAALGYPGTVTTSYEQGWRELGAAGEGARGSGDRGVAGGRPGEGAGAYPNQGGAGAYLNQSGSNDHGSPAEGGRGTTERGGAFAPTIRYQLIAGERRWLAAKRAGLATIPAIVKQVSNEQAMEMTIIENLQREDLNPMDQARAFERLGNEFGLTQEQMAARTGKDRASIGNYVRLLRLPAEVQGFVEGGSLSMGHAKALLAIEDTGRLTHYAQMAVAQQWTVRKTEYEVQRYLHPEPKPEKEERQVDPNVREAERELERSLGVRVKIDDHQGKGKVVIEYKSLEDFDRIVEALSK
ncbi:MAG TPA: ParB/RepB/Spo0J family partition protein [Terriglobales bacterium]|nr:ParB/RepB/Spo0J family partition protein [Terriglobales bacterium]